MTRNLIESAGTGHGMASKSGFWERPQDFVTVKETAHRLRTSESTVRRWIRLGELVAVRVGRTLWVHLPSLHLKIQEPTD
jgi:excisionase family DNA binding protein